MKTLLSYILIDRLARDWHISVSFKIYYYPLAILSAEIRIDDSDRIIDFDNEQLKKFVSRLPKETKKDYTDYEIRINEKN